MAHGRGAGWRRRGSAGVSPGADTAGIQRQSKSRARPGMRRGGWVIGKAATARRRKAVICDRLILPCACRCGGDWLGVELCNEHRWVCRTLCSAKPHRHGVRRSVSAVAVRCCVSRASYQRSFSGRFLEGRSSWLPRLASIRHLEFLGVHISYVRFDGSRRESRGGRRRVRWRFLCVGFGHFHNQRHDD